MSLWHCPEHGLVGPGPCCINARLAHFRQLTQAERDAMDRALDKSVTVIDPGYESDAENSGDEKHG